MSQILIKDKYTSQSELISKVKEAVNHFYIGKDDIYISYVIKKTDGLIDTRRQISKIDILNSFDISSLDFKDECVVYISRKAANYCSLEQIPITFGKDQNTLLYAEQYLGNNHLFMYDKYSSGQQKIIDTKNILGTRTTLKLLEKNKFEKFFKKHRSVFEHVVCVIVKDNFLYVHNKDLLKSEDGIHYTPFNSVNKKKEETVVKTNKMYTEYMANLDFLDNQKCNLVCIKNSDSGDSDIFFIEEVRYERSRIALSSSLTGENIIVPYYEFRLDYKIFSYLTYENFT